MVCNCFNSNLKGGKKSAKCLGVFWNKKTLIEEAAMKRALKKACIIGSRIIIIAGTYQRPKSLYHTPGP